VKLLTVAQILAWADAHKVRTAAWPVLRSGPVREAPDLTWMAIDQALRQGLHGLPAGDSLPRLLARERGARPRMGPQPAHARVARAARLRAGGLTLAEVGRRLGITPQAVRHLLLRKAAREAKGTAL
jgi:DNA-binding CsgD family transcriptional regulator